MCTETEHFKQGILYIMCRQKLTGTTHAHIRPNKMWVIPTVLDVPTLLIRYTLFLNIVEQKDDL